MYVCNDITRGGENRSMLKHLTASSTTALALAAHQVAHGGVGVARHGLANAIHTAQALLGDVAGGIGHSAHGASSGLDQVAYRAVDLAEQTVVATGLLATHHIGTTTLTIGTAALALSTTAAVTTIGHYALLLSAKKRNASKGLTYLLHVGYPDNP
jgi:hypothetical protein